MSFIIDPFRYATGAPPAFAIAATGSYNSNDVAFNAHNLTLPASISAGDLLLIFAMFAGQTVTDPAGWTVLFSINGSGNDRLRIYAKIADGLEGSTVTVSLSGNVRAASLSYRITGHANDLSSSGIAVSSVVSGSTLTPNPPSLTPSWGSYENIWFAVDWYGDSNTTFGGLTSDYPANYTLSQLFEKNGGGSNGMLLAVAARMLTAASDDPGVFTHTGSAKNCDAQTIAVKSA